MSKYVYSFGGGTADGDGKMKDTLGGKGAGLAEMSRAGVPVPPGFTISTDVCKVYYENNNQLTAEIKEQSAKCLALLEEQKGLPFGAIWDYFCWQQGVAVGMAFMDQIRDYEKRVQLPRG